MIRSLITIILLIVFFVFSLPLLGILWFVRKANRKLADTISQSILSGVCRLLIFIAGIDLEIHGRENIPENTPVLFVANHTSYFDIVCMLSQTHSNLMGFVAKKEMAKIPSFRIWMKRINCIFLDREDIRAGMQAILDSIDNIKSGISMTIFPEGTRYNDGIMHEFKGGSLKIATKSGCPIVPVSIRGGEDVFEKHVPFIRATKVVLRYGTPIDPGTLTPDEKKNLPSMVRAKVLTMFNS